MWLQSSFLVENKSSTGSFPHGQGSLLPAMQMDGSGGWEAGTQLSQSHRKGKTGLWGAVWAVQHLSKCLLKSEGPCRGDVSRDSVPRPL